MQLTACPEPAEGAQAVGKKEEQEPAPEGRKTREEVETEVLMCGQPPSAVHTAKLRHPSLVECSLKSRFARTKLVNIVASSHSEAPNHRTCLQSPCRRFRKLDHRTPLFTSKISSERVPSSDLRTPLSPQPMSLFLAQRLLPRQELAKCPLLRPRWQLQLIHNFLPCFVGRRTIP